MTCSSNYIPLANGALVYTSYMCIGFYDKTNLCKLYRPKNFLNTQLTMAVYIKLIIDYNVKFTLPNKPSL